MSKLAADFDIARIDEVIHGRVRLGAMTFLAARGDAEFTVLREHLDVTDGNLSTHLRKLEEAGYIVQSKSFVGKRPMTRLALTPDGRRAFIGYLDAMRALLDTADR